MIRKIVKTIEEKFNVLRLNPISSTEQENDIDFWDK